MNGEALIGDGLLISILFPSLSLLIFLCALSLGTYQWRGIEWQRAPHFHPIFPPFLVSIICHSHSSYISTARH